MKKIVLFGATGNTGMYFAAYCLEHLDKNEYELVCVGRKATDWFKNNGITYYQVDIRFEDDFKKLPQENVHAVINMAGLLPAYLKEYDPFKYIDTNVTGGMRILEYARKTVLTACFMRRPGLKWQVSGAKKTYFHLKWKENFATQATTHFTQYQRV